MLVAADTQDWWWPSVVAVDTEMEQVQPLADIAAVSELSRVAVQPERASAR